MNREIKFRAWNQNTNKMIDLHEVTPLALSINVKEDTDGLYLPFIKGLILMQFTGLKDKNNKDIYEGDILKPVKNSKYKQPPNGLLCVVVWDSHWVTFKGLKDNQKDGEYVLNDGNAKDHWEVIGNIYENPELINPK